MTIKRRLSISNNLMVIIPVIFSMAASGIVVSIAMRALGFSVDNDDNRINRINSAYAQMQELSYKWSEDCGPEQIIRDADEFNEQYAGSGISLAVYQNQEPVYPFKVGVDSRVFEMALSEKGKHNYTMDQTAVYTQDAGEYTVVLVNTSYALRESQFLDNRQYIIQVFLVVFLLALGIIRVTNHLLTRMVLKRIITPLNTLAFGVHQIWDGNLDYRIEYNENDEFSGVCADFNEMAQRLLDMINARRKDDESRRELIAGISHDLRTPLTSIKAYIEGLEKGVAATPQMEKMYFDTIKSKSNDLEHIISQLFLFSKLDVGEFPFHMEDVDIGDILSGYVDVVCDEYSLRGLEISITENITGCTVQVDRVQLGNVFANIFENSLKYANKERAAVQIVCRAENGGVAIAFTDNGPGVPEDVLDKLFNVFYRSDRARTNPSQGSGLGLAISTKIMERFGGSIMAANAPEGGLCMTLRLPIATGINERNI